MLKREIKYEDWDGVQTSDVFYFNISKPELIDMEVEHKGGLAVYLEKIIEAKDHKELVNQLKEIVLKAYGVRSDDGKRFIKTDEIREEFSQTAAYPALFMELASDDRAAIIFLRGVMPQDMVEGIDVEQLQQAARENSPKPPSPPTT